ncbi:OLC1v1038475C3 [Oldenlandia corymbosa var. corymbosa]|uniref:OLC1v1038475C3 n=1 Tax=Oldenlandia corymbosa var. corymbosa TaxID=529605 RepID=A0AAV1D0V6_OLDCO|nr:OLC1v1038475C3 [Oldenlandia corymbosa var. corymbosa]
MGSLENGFSLKRDHHHLLRSSSSGSGRSFFSGSSQSLRQQLRSRLARLVFLKKFDYPIWICMVAVFLFFLVLFQMLLPGSIMDKSGDFLKKMDNNNNEVAGDLVVVREFAGLDFGEDIKFEPSKLLAKFRGDDAIKVNGNVLRLGHRKPKIAMVFADLLVDAYQIQMATISIALRKIGYEIEVLSLKDGPANATWRGSGFPLHLMESHDNKQIAIDWLNYEGVLVNSLESAAVISRLMMEPFKSVPLIWTIHEQELAARMRLHAQNGQSDIVENWKKVFSRATVVVFHNYILPMIYSACDTGNYFVIPGSPAEAWEAGNILATPKNVVRVKVESEPKNFNIVIVGSQLLYRGLWLEHALVLKALLPVLEHFEGDGITDTRLKIIVLAGDSNSNYSVALEAIAVNLTYPAGMVTHIALDENLDNILSSSDLVIYSSFHEEPSFPNILLRAMCLKKPIVAPDISIIKKYVDDRVNGYIFPRENIRVLSQILMQVISNGKLSLLASNAAAIGKHTAKNLMVSESVEGYASLLESVLRFPSEVTNVEPVSEIPANLKAEWSWTLFEASRDSVLLNATRRIMKFLDEFEQQWNQTQNEGSVPAVGTNENFFYGIWEEEKSFQIAYVRKRREDDELKDRTDQSRGTWDEVYRSARRADRIKNDVHERDEGELERTGQPLTIYEPFIGEGTWPFLHHTSLYRGFGLSSKGRRPGFDDVDGPSRLPLLSNPYYRDVLGEYGAYFAIANRIDRIHKNAWIGFQSWRATARKESLSRAAEISLLNAIQSRKHGDALYFWASMDKDPRNPQKQDFWTFCDAINAGNCQFAFSEAFRKMYGLNHNLSSVPPMPVDGGDTWSVMHSWALPTRSFMEFVMFSRFEYVILLFFFLSFLYCSCSMLFLFLFFM